MWKPLRELSGDRAAGGGHSVGEGLGAGGCLCEDTRRIHVD